MPAPVGLVTAAALRGARLPPRPALASRCAGRAGKLFTQSACTATPRVSAASATADTLTITKPDDFHVHFRDGEGVLGSVVPHTSARFSRALVMPNLVPPVTTTTAAMEYRSRIMNAVPDTSGFQPMMTLYLTDETSPDELHKAAASGKVMAVKLYPAGATTNSSSGVQDVSEKNGLLQDNLKALTELGIPLCVHGEVTDPGVDVFDRERVFLETKLAPLLERHTGLKVVVEHATTRDAVAFVLKAGSQVGATITPQHLLLNRNALFQGGLRPHHYCLPILKREEHRLALLEQVCNGNPKFFLGTDSAPHPRGAKESACGCAGVYSAHAAVEFYATVLEDEGALDKLEGFASHHGADFYGLERNRGTLTLVREDWQVPAQYPFGETIVVPFFAGQTLRWRAAAPE